MEVSASIQERSSALVAEIPNIYTLKNPQSIFQSGGYITTNSRQFRQGLCSKAYSYVSGRL